MGAALVCLLRCNKKPVGLCERGEGRWGGKVTRSWSLTMTYLGQFFSLVGCRTYWNDLLVPVFIPTGLKSNTAVMQLF